MSQPDRLARKALSGLMALLLLPMAAGCAMSSQDAGPTAAASSSSPTVSASQSPAATTIESDGSTVTTPDGRLSVWVPSTWAKTTTETGFTATAPDGVTTLTVESQGLAPQGTILAADANGLLVKPIPGGSGLELRQGWTFGQVPGGGAVLTYATEQGRAENRGFSGIGGQGVARVEVSTPNSSAAISTPETIKAAVDEYRASEVGKQALAIVESLHVN